MGNLKTYYTGLISDDWDMFPHAPYKGKGWIIDFEKTKSCKKVSNSGFEIITKLFIEYIYIKFSIDLINLFNIC